MFACLIYWFQFYEKQRDAVETQLSRLVVAASNALSCAFDRRPRRTPPATATACGTVVSRQRDDVSGDELARSLESGGGVYTAGSSGSEVLLQQEIVDRGTVRATGNGIRRAGRDRGNNCAGDTGAARPIRGWMSCSRVRAAAPSSLGCSTSDSHGLNWPLSRGVCPPRRVLASQILLFLLHHIEVIKRLISDIHDVTLFVHTQGETSENEAAATWTPVTHRETERA
eukprot:GHVT01050440.1.p1 GENE.GHVT01050440.1~~GHVT01050440.1.p1  ORF type:complete len:227 (-),score=26.36 GHVT01050440.1:143-823(-)